MDRRAQPELAALTAEAREFLARIGAALREARIEAGEDLHQVADTLRIKPAYLQALESGDYDVFPGRAYAFGFLRAYADYLGFDGSEVVRRVRARLTADEPPPAPPVRRPFIERHRPTALAATALVLLIGAGYWGWYAVRALGPDLLERVGEVPGELARATDRLVEEPTIRPAPEETRPQLVRLAAEDGAPTVIARLGPDDMAAIVVAATTRQGNAASATAAELPPTLATEARGEAGASPADVALPQRVVLRARATTWVQIYTEDGSFTDTRTLEAGQELVVPDRPGLRLWTGDGGAVELVVDGRSLGTVGARGQVVEGFVLERRSLAARLREAG